MSSAEDVAADMRASVARTDHVAVTQNNEVFASLDRGEGEDNLVGMDRLCTIAFDHGYVPRGILESGCARFKPRDEV